MGSFQRSLFLFVLGFLLPALYQCSHSPPSNTPSSQGFTFLIHTKLGYQWVMPGEFSGILEQEGFSFYHPEGEILLGTVWISSLPVLDRPTDLLALEELMGRNLLDLKTGIASFAPDGVVRYDVVQRIEGLDFYGDPVTVAEIAFELLPAFRRPPRSVLEWGARVLGNTSSHWQGIPPGKESLSFRLLLALGKLHDYTGRWVVGDGGKGIVTALWVGTPEGEETPSRWQESALPFSRLQPLVTRFARLSEKEEVFSQAGSIPTLAMLLVGNATGSIQGQEIERVKGLLLKVFQDFSGLDVDLRIGFLRSCQDQILSFSPGGDPFLSSRSPNFANLLKDNLDLLWSTTCPGNRLFWSGIRAYRTYGGEVWRNAHQRWLMFVTEGGDASPCLEDVLGSSCPDPGEFSQAIASDQVVPFGVGYVELPCNRSDAVVAPADRASDVKQLVESQGGNFFEYCEDWGGGLQSALKGRAYVLAGNHLSRTPIPGTLEVFLGERKLYPDPVTGYLYLETLRSILPGQGVAFGEPLRALYKTMVEPAVP